MGFTFEPTATTAAADATSPSEHSVQGTLPVAAAAAAATANHKVRRCRLIVPKPKLKACLVSALETKL